MDDFTPWLLGLAALTTLYVGGSLALNSWAHAVLQEYQWDHNLRLEALDAKLVLHKDSYVPGAQYWILVVGQIKHIVRTPFAMWLLLRKVHSGRIGYMGLARMKP